MNLVADIVEFIKSNRGPVNRREIIVEMVSVSSRCKLWPMASYEQWDAAIEHAIRDGLIIATDGGEIVCGRVEESKKETAKSSQMELF